MLIHLNTLFTKFLVILSGALLVSSCIWMKPVDERISEARDDVSDKYLKQVRLHQNGGFRGKLHITWQQGLEKMYLANPNLIQADYRMLDAKYRQKQVWRNMIPGLSVGLSDSKTIKDIGDIFSDSSFRINSFISLGNLLDLPSTVYTNKLTYIGSALQSENTMRQQVITLYRLFQEQKLHRIEKQALDLESQILASISGKDASDSLDMKLRHKEAIENYERNIKDWKTKVGDFFMSGFEDIYLDPNGIPDIIYDPNKLDFSDTKRWGLLQLNLLALENIAEDGRILDTYLRYLPTANLSVSAPPLYSNTNGQSFDPANIRLSPSFNWNLDSRGYIGRQLYRIKREQPLRDWRKDRRTREEVKKLFEGKELLIKIKKELTELRAAIEIYKKAVGSGLVKDPQKAVQTMRNLKEKEVRLMAREIEICSTFWLIDEKRWRPITKRWLQTRKQRTTLRENSDKYKELNFKNQVKKWAGKKKKE